MHLCIARQCIHVSHANMTHNSLATLYIDTILFTAAAEVQDAAESHETTVVRLNKQLADKCVELMDKEKEVNELRGELTALREEVGRMKERENGEGALLTEVEALRQKVGVWSVCVCAWVRACMCVHDYCLDNSSVTALHINTLILYSYTHAKVHVTIQSGVHMLQTSIECHHTHTHTQLSTSETSTEYALAEVDILTSRISELTSEKEQVEAGKNEAEGKLKEALEQVSTGNVHAVVHIFYYRIEVTDTYMVSVLPHSWL